MLAPEMKTIETPRFRILIAGHSGMCFGVRQAIEATETLLSSRPATILGELAHNPVVKSRMTGLGAREGDLEGEVSATPDVVITAHGASDRDRLRWKQQGYRVLDTTCPLVHVAHRKLRALVNEGYFPVIVGKAGHVEVRGLLGDFPGAQVILNQKDIERLPPVKRLGIISQTTQPIEKVRALVHEVRLQRPEVEVVFHDTVCQPTKDRQQSLDELCKASELVLAIGGRGSNNTAALAGTARLHGCRAYHIEGPDNLCDEWFEGVQTVGLTAGTSTLDESVEAVTKRLREMAAMNLVP